jgi:predicted acyltransferase
VLVQRRKHHLGVRYPRSTLTREDHVASLDAFRGFTVAGMILVNNPGSWTNVLEWLTHADWNGCTLADVVFPFFIFILGAAMPFAFARRIGRGHRTRDLLLRILRRTAWLLALGVTLNIVAAFPVLGGLRLPGVLQRIGVVYLLAAPIVLNVGAAGRAAILVVLALTHWAVLTVGPFAGLGPLHNGGAVIDRAVFGTHILTEAGDPEGLLGTLPALGTALLGSIAGECLRRPGSPRSRVRDLVMIGVASAAVGLAWATVLPINKSLWTGSFLLWTGGIAALIFAGCYWVMDVQGWRAWARPFMWLGFNPLAIYFLSELVSHMFDKPWLRVDGQILTIRSWLFWDGLRPLIPDLGDEWLSLAAALLTVVFWAGVAGMLYRRDIRLQV